MVTSDGTSSITKDTYGEKLIAEYIHQGNQEIHFTDFDWETGIGTTSEPHGLKNNTRIMIVPNEWWVEGTGLTYGMRYIPYEWIKYDGDIYLSVVDETKLKVVGNDQTSIITVNLSDSPTNNNVDIKKIHFEIPIGYAITNLKTDSLRFLITYFGYIKSKTNRYMWVSGEWKDSPNVNSDFGYTINYLGIPTNYHVSKVCYGGFAYLKTEVDLSMPKMFYYSRFNKFLGRRYGSDGNVIDQGTEKEEHLYELNKEVGKVTGFANHNTYAYMCNNGIVRIYALSEEPQDE